MQPILLVNPANQVVSQPGSFIQGITTFPAGNIPTPQPAPVPSGVVVSQPNPSNQLIGQPSWWTQQSAAMHAGIVIGAGAVIVGALYFFTKKSSYRPNAPRRKNKKYTRRTKGKLTLKQYLPIAAFAIKHGRTKPPKGYPKKRSQYAFPEGYMYPINTRQRVRTAASRFGKYKRRYPAAVREKIAKRLDAAKRHFGIGEYR